MEMDALAITTAPKRITWLGNPKEHTPHTDDAVHMAMLAKRIENALELVICISI
ncbi:hypothetical protein D9M68_458620 [compost metagenome]